MICQFLKHAYETNCKHSKATAAATGAYPVFAHGAIRLGTTVNSRSDVLVSAYRNGAKKVVVAINTGSGQVNQKISFQGTTASTVIPYVTSSSKNAVQGGILALSDNSFVYVLPSLSVVTFVEQ